MALPPLADVPDLSAWVGRDIAPDNARAGAVLSAASARFRREAHQTWVDEASGALTDVPDDVRYVVAQMAARVWNNPGSLEYAKVDDAQRGWGQSGVLGLYMTDDELALAHSYRPAGATPSGLGVISTSRGDGASSTIYVPTGPEPSGYPFPWYDSDDPWVAP